MRWFAGAVGVGLAALLVGIAIWAILAGDGSARYGPAIASGVLVLGAGITAYALRRRREIRTRSMEPDSIERALAAEAQAGTFRDLLLVAAGLLLVFVLWQEIPALLGPVIMLVAGVVDFFVRFAWAKARAR